MLGIVLHLLVRELMTNEMLEGENGVCRVDDSLALSGQTDKTFAMLGEGDDGGCCPLTLSVLDDTRSLALDDGDSLRRRPANADLRSHKRFQGAFVLFTSTRV
jgi:hypothetical protein